MIKSITVINHLNESIKLELAFPEKSGFAIRYINGLGPGKAIINDTEMSTSDGTIYNSARLNARNIVLSLIFLGKPIIEDARQKSYKYFPIKKRVHLIIETDNRICETYGYVESNEPEIFGPSVGTQISIICPDPYLYSAGKDGRTLTVFSGLEPVFEFPFSNESTTESLMNMGVIQYKTEQTVYYSGDSEIGILLTIRALGEIQNITIYNTWTRETMKIDTDRMFQLTGSVIVLGDEITISTLRNDKYALLLRGGEEINILSCIDKTSDWFRLVKGDNIFAYAAEVGTSNLQFKIENQTVYEGV